MIPRLLSGGKKDRAKLPELVPQWEEEIRSAELPEDEEKEAAELLIYAIMQRFSNLSLEEVRKMIHLTPLEQTVAVQELMQITRDEGELIGNIRMAQRFLKRRMTPKEKLIGKSPDELKKMLKKLESELKL